MPYFCIIIFRATETAGVAKGTATITLNIQNKLEFASASLAGCVVTGAIACKFIVTVWRLPLSFNCRISVRSHYILATMIDPKTSTLNLLGSLTIL